MNPYYRYAQDLKGYFGFEVSDDGVTMKDIYLAELFD